jgi:hypothetical protein
LQEIFDNFVAAAASYPAAAKARAVSPLIALSPPSRSQKHNLHFRASVSRSTIDSARNICAPKKNTTVKKLLDKQFSSVGRVGMMQSNLLSQKFSADFRKLRVKRAVSERFIAKEIP